ncbi:MAG: GtrA family protein [Sphingomicrobium sp.]
MKALVLSTARKFSRLIRYYQAAVVNTLFGFGLYAILVAAGLNMFVAQGIGFVCGVTFNYFTYSRHAFRDRQGSKRAFVLAYGVNYLVNLALLAGFSLVLRSPYLAGLAATLIASLVNYFVLREVVFKQRVPGEF